MTKVKESSFLSWERASNEKFQWPIDAQISNYDVVFEADKLVSAPIMSVIVLTYNHHDSIEKCVASIVDQDTQYPYEILLADDGSDDGNIEICRQLQRRHPDKVKLLIAKRNYKSFTVNILRAYRHLRGEYVTWCEGDDYWMGRNRVEKQISYMLSHPEVVFSVGQMIRRVLSTGEERIFPEDLSEGTTVFIKDGYRFFHISTWCTRKDYLLSLVPVLSEVGYITDSAVLILAEGDCGISVHKGIVSCHMVTGEGSWSSLNTNQERAARLRYLKSRYRHFPRHVHDFCAQQLFGAYFEFAIAFAREGEVVNLLFVLLNMVKVFIKNPKAAASYMKKRIHGRFDGNR